ncbi:MAG: hypothetical protein FWB95_05005 [Treponema sp.]|nr:hypothetical protein [Treponema sp.]
MLFIPAIFIVWIIADVIRRAVYPDIVMTSGFWGILRAKVFWRIGPQVIACLIIVIILMNCTVSYVEDRPVGNASSLIAEVESIMDEMEPIAEKAFRGNLSPSLEAKYEELENKLISVLQKLEKHEDKLTEKEKEELWRIVQKYKSFE